VLEIGGFNLPVPIEVGRHAEYVRGSDATFVKEVC
jgi:hypothetical protein